MGKRNSKPSDAPAMPWAYDVALTGGPEGVPDDEYDSILAVAAVLESTQPTTTAAVSSPARMVYTDFIEEIPDLDHDAGWNWRETCRPMFSRP